MTEELDPTRDATLAFEPELAFACSDEGGEAAAIDEGEEGEAPSGGSSRPVRGAGMIFATAAASWARGARAR